MVITDGREAIGGGEVIRVGPFIRINTVLVYPILGQKNNFTLPSYENLRNT